MPVDGVRVQTSRCLFLQPTNPQLKIRRPHQKNAYDLRWVISIGVVSLRGPSIYTLFLNRLVKRMHRKYPFPQARGQEARPDSIYRTVTISGMKSETQQVERP